MRCAVCYQPALTAHASTVCQRCRDARAQPVPRAEPLRLFTPAPAQLRGQTFMGEDENGR